MHEKFFSKLLRFDLKIFQLRVELRIFFKYLFNTKNKSSHVYTFSKLGLVGIDCVLLMMQCLLYFLINKSYVIYVMYVFFVFTIQQQASKPMVYSKVHAWSCIVNFSIYTRIFYAKIIHFRCGPVLRFKFSFFSFFYIIFSSLVTLLRWVAIVYVCKNLKFIEHQLLAFQSNDNDDVTLLRFIPHTYIYVYVIGINMEN